MSLRIGNVVIFMAVSVIVSASLMLPIDVIDRIDGLSTVIGFLGEFLPSVDRFRRCSLFSQVATSVYAAGVMLLPFSVWALQPHVKQLDPMSAPLMRRYPKVGLVLGIAFCISLPVVAGAYLPGTPDLSGAKAARFSWFVCSTRIGLSLGVVILMVSSAVGFLLSYYYGRKLVLLLRN